MDLAHWIEGWAGQAPDKPAIITDSETLTYAGFAAAIDRAARALRHELGVGAGDRVAHLGENSVAQLVLFFACARTGVSLVTLNWRLAPPEHGFQLADSGASLLFADPGFIPHADAIPDRAPGLKHVSLGPAEGQWSAWSDHLAAAASGAAIAPEASHETPVLLVYTSGTTGRPKGAVLTQGNVFWNAVNATHAHDMVSTDLILTNLPLFHVGGTIFLYVMLAKGGSCVVEDSFRTDGFWESVRRNGVTSTCLVGAMTPFLLKLPPSNRDRDHPMRSIVTIPWNEDSLALGQRYGIDMYTGFNMTEISSPITSEANPPKIGTCGTARDGVEVRVVDENDCEVAPGVVGELIVRTDRPWAMNHGYYKNPEATAKAWRNGWFHTGDAFRVDGDGNYFFVDRFKDSIRRRGENVSSFEVEAEICAHPAVREAAVVAVPAAESEDEILVAVSLTDGATLSPQELIEHLRPRMAHFMIPRYVRMLADLPKTPTNKVEKYLIRKDGVTADTWDRDAAGIVVKREKIGHT